jgi:hypothetical protein
MLFKKIISLFLESYETNKYTLWENAELFIIIAGGAYSYHWDLKG